MFIKIDLRETAGIGTFGGMTAAYVAEMARTKLEKDLGRIEKIREVESQTFDALPE